MPVSSQPRRTIAELQDAVAEQPDPANLYALGHARLVRWEFAEAADLLARAASAADAEADWWFELAAARAALEEYGAAADAQRAGLQRRDTPAATTRLGELLECAGDRAAALECYRQVIRHVPDHGHALIAIYRWLLDEYPAGEVPAAARRLADEHMPAADSRARACGFAQALEQRGRYSAAREVWQQILRTSPEHARARLGIAATWMAQGDLDAAAQAFACALARHPTDPEIVVLHLTFLQRCGDIEALRARIADPEARRAAMWAGGLDPALAPLWDGTQPLGGRRLLVQPFGGYGDMLQYARFASLLQARGATVILQAPPRLAPLLRTLSGVDEVIAPFDAWPTVDYQCGPFQPAWFLPWTWSWLRETVPYLSVDRERVAAWDRQFERPALHIGIAWRCADTHDARNPSTYRSVPLTAFEPLSRIPGVIVHGLQVGPGVSEITSSIRGWLRDNLPLDATDFRDAAAAIQALDVIVSADSSLAHLAGALGRRCWLLLPHYPAARWMTASPRAADGACVWYPSMRLCPQARPGDWGSAMQRVVDDCTTLAQAQHLCCP
jgi:tetratricopeptide (TPR) repeat protein